MIRVVIPHHLQTLAQTGAEVSLNVRVPQTARSVIRALETKYPSLRGTIIDHATGVRRPKVRLFACQEDISHASLDDVLPQAVIEGKEQLLIVGAISGG
jgi:molybdopterin synthase sulfur carrier subunit